MTTPKANRFATAAQRTSPSAIVEPAVPEKARKYTMTISAPVRAMIDEDVRRLADQTGQLVDRKAVTVALYELLHEDESLFAEVKRRLLSKT